MEGLEDFYEEQSKFIGNSGAWNLFDSGTDYSRLCTANHGVSDCIGCSGDHPDWAV